MSCRSLTVAILLSCLAASPVLALQGSRDEPDSAPTHQRRAYQAYSAREYAECAAAFERAAEVPRDLAYVLGSRIVKAYYDRADDKRQAVREILAVTDYPAFLEKSRYGEQFED